MRLTLYRFRRRCELSDTGVLKLDVVAGSKAEAHSIVSGWLALNPQADHHLVKWGPDSLESKIHLRAGVVLS